MSRLLLDTDILINWLRGEKEEKAILLSSGIDFYYSRLSRKELNQYKNISAKERKKISYLFNCLREIPITQEIAAKASTLLQRYSKKPLKPADAIIAATAWEKNLVLATRNKKHFEFIKEIKLLPTL
ncbi:MAG TPA: hypothetical protein DDW49_02995 [Deltaproteobacteria bacterium]|nr:MAG: hypothetical protein A2048_04935 [Deltaproteobacteria bacterium GWA2_45_12]HBF12347.1 hypothetical protein [Deltaproteobacteria bacterium]